jgi:hypothetical protein
MIRLTTVLRSVAVGIPLALAACSDPVGPGASPSNEVSAPKALVGLNSLNKKAVEWSYGHTTGTYSVTGVIGSKGGRLSIPASDFSITFDAGAVSSPTMITITSIDGKYVSYDMQPHGLTFRAPVTVTQGLKHTEAYYNVLMLPGLAGAYVESDDPPAEDGSFVATELLPSVTYVTKLLFGIVVPDRQTWDLKHFSRYMLASG